MTTLTIPLDRLEDVRPGDRLVAIDGVTLSFKRVFTDGPQRVRMGGPVGIPFEYGSAVTGYFYPDSLVTHSITVERVTVTLNVESAPFGRCADCGHRMEADENTCTPCTQAERARLDAALAPKKARKPVTRTIDGLRLVSQGGGAWLTEDGRYEVRLNYGGLTECEGPHPVRVTWEMREWARQNSTHASAKPILTAIALNQRGYYCQGAEEHQAPDSWIAWDIQRDDYAGPSGSHAESFTDAARDLAAYLRSQEG